MRLFLIAFGKLKTPGLRESMDYYLKLTRTWLPTEEIELKPLPVSDKSPETRRQIQEKEGELLLDRLSRLLSPRGEFYLFDEGGQVRSTRLWADKVLEWEKNGVPEVALCIGSSLGFSPAVRKSARGILSLGPQTLPHELARVVAQEQLYRAWSVTRGHPYHNDGS